MALDMKKLIETQINSSDHLSKKHVHPRLGKMLQLGGMNTVFTKAQGQYLFDQNGDKFLDLLAGGGVHFIGRNHPTVMKALRDVTELEMPNLCVVNSSVLGGVLAEKLTTLVGGGIGKVQYANSGTEATDISLRFARFITRRRRFVYLEGAFHGRSFAAISICGFSQMKEGMDPLMPTVTPVRVNDLEQLKRELSKGDVAAFIYEAVQGMTCNVLDASYLREAEKLCRQYGTLLIADEVQTGLARLGDHWFAAQAYGVTPDMINISKTLSGGQVPISACMIKDSVYEDVFKKFVHGPIYFSTFAENNLAMAAGIATLDVLESMNAPRRARELSDKFRSGLYTLAEKYDCIDRIAGKGLMIGIYFRESQKRRLRIQQELMGVFDGGAFAASVNVEMYRDKKMIVQLPGPGLSAIKLLPPVTLADSDVDWFLNSFEDLLSGYYKTSGPLVALGKAVVASTTKDVKNALGMKSGPGIEDDTEKKSETTNGVHA